MLIFILSSLDKNSDHDRAFLINLRTVKSTIYFIQRETVNQNTLPQAGFSLGQLLAKIVVELGQVLKLFWYIDFDAFKESLRSGRSRWDHRIACLVPNN